VIAQACGAKAEMRDDLNDIDYGAWQFRTYAEVRDETPDLFTAWFATPHLVRFPDGESLQDLVARAANALRFVLMRHPGETVVLVGQEATAGCISSRKSRISLRSSGLRPGAV
jgi:phosphoserine phosphatase